ncbi:MAG: OmpH family outer membrane protein [Candidatus Cloacimonadales bacterium]|nr:OmpH family outer membrane protein [Candidatus Cloacimonadales bacterium]
MKKGFLILALLIIATAIFAETDKMAYIDTDRIMAESPETQEAQTILLNERQKWEQEIGEMDTEIQQLYTDYDSKKMILTASGKQEAETKITDLQQKRQAKVEEIFGENGKFAQKQAELLEPILNKLKAVIEKVAVENNFSIIFDAASGGLLYAKPNMDITDLVIEEMAKAVE